MMTMRSARDTNRDCVQRPLRIGPRLRRAPFALAVLAVLVLGASCATTPNTDAAALPAGNWIADPAHTSVTFRIAHGGGLSRYTARFDTVEASLDFDPQKPQTATLTARIDAMSVSTGMTAFDGKLAKEVFNAEAHPFVVFTSDEITAVSDNRGTVSGALSMAGQTHPVALDVTFNGSAFDPLRGRTVAGFSATTTLDRTLWGLSNWVNFGVGKDVDVNIEIEFLKAG